MPPRTPRAPASNPAPLEVVEWAAFAELFEKRHRRGEHVAIVGPTGSGKSTVGLELAKILARRRNRDGRPASVVVLADKPRDRTMSALGWPIIKTWPPAYGQEHCIVWPRFPDPETRAAKQARVFGPLLRRIYQEGSQTVYIDEAAYFEAKPPNGLGLGSTLDQYWGSARALDLTLIAATQRPRKVSRSMWSEPKWVLVFRLDDEDDLKRVGEIGGNRREVFEAVQRLGGHEFLAIVKPAGGRRELYVSRFGN